MKPLPHRRITEDTCARYGYKLAKVNGTIYEVATYHKNGQPVGQKLRSPSKDFTSRGDMRDAPLFGQNLWSGGGKRIVVTEGEIDAMSVFQAQGSKWPVVSVPSGAAGAHQAFRNNLEFLNGYDEVVICFDSDEPGQKAAIECALVLPPGKARIATLPAKDANEMLVSGDVQKLTDCIWQAQPYRPDGIIHVADVKPPDPGAANLIHDYPWDEMTRRLWGRRSGEVCMHTSGSGMGKSTVLRELALADLNAGLKVGMLMLEESTNDTLNSLLSLLINKRVGQILAGREINRRRTAAGKTPLDFGIEDDLTDAELTNARNWLNSKPLYLYDHFGSLECDTLMQKLEYMRAGLGCDIIYLDHISIVISGQESQNERKDIDVLMTKLASFVKRSNVRVEAVCHLTKPPGQAYEEGGQISLKDLRGSGALGQLSMSVLGYERNQQHKDKTIANTIMVRSLKDRFSGYLGLTSAFRFDQSTGRLKEVPWSYDTEGNVTFGHSSTPHHDPTAPFDDLSDESGEETLV